MTEAPARHLAQLNIGRFAAPLDDPRMAGFVENLDRINALADRMPGFVWRLQGENGNATDIPWVGDPTIAVNLSVWESGEALERFTFGTLHRTFYARRREWFDAFAGHHLVLWWVPAGHRPDLAEAAARLAHLEAHGDTEHAFAWSGLPDAGLWRTARCDGMAAE